MLYYALTFLLVGLVAGALGESGRVLRRPPSRGSQRVISL